MRRAIASYRAIGANLADTTCSALLVETFGRVGRAGEGLDLVGELLASARDTGERNDESELYRLRGDLLLALDATSSAEAEASFGRAVECARHQRAKSLELRAAMSLARLWRKRGKREEARRMLTDVHGWFTEGFDTADLREARMLLDSLSTA